MGYKIEVSKREAEVMDDMKKRILEHLSAIADIENEAWTNLEFNIQSTESYSFEDLHSLVRKMVHEYGF